MYFAFGHPFNPFLWHADGKLLRDIERIAHANGALPPKAAMHR